MKLLLVLVGLMLAGCASTVTSRCWTGQVVQDVDGMIRLSDEPCERPVGPVEQAYPPLLPHVVGPYYRGGPWWLELRRD